MTKKITLSVVAATVLATSVYATNGDNLIGTGAASRAMGGTGVANYTNGIEALYRNPALMGQSKTNTLSLGVTYFDPTVKSSVTNQAQGFPTEQTATSATKASFIPEMGITYNLDESVHFGFGVFGAAGMGVDYKGEAAQSQLKSELNLARIIPGASYDINEMISVGVAPVITYGQMSMNYDAGTGSQSNRENSTATAFGAQVGLAIRPIKGLTIGLTYNSSAKLTYSKVANFEQFGLAGQLGSIVKNAKTFNADGTLSTTSESENIQKTGYTPAQGIQNAFYDPTKPGTTLAEQLANPQTASAAIAAAGTLGITDASGNRFSDKAYAAGLAAGTTAATSMQTSGTTENTNFTARVTQLVTAGEEQAAAQTQAGQEIVGAAVGAAVNTVSTEAATAVNSSTTAQSIGASGIAAADDDLILEQPAELALGIGYVMGDLALTADYRNIAWSKAEGYKDFGWQDQTVIALGASYNLGSLTLRAGYNKADSVIEETKSEKGNAGLVNVQGHQIFQQSLSMLNMVGFPAISTTHYTFGLGYAIDNAMSIDFAAVISPEASVTRKGTLAAGASTTDPTIPYDFTTTMQQNSYTVALNYNF